MIHPHDKNLAEYTTMQLEQRLLKLNSMYFGTQNPDLHEQMILLIDSYKLELESRYAAAKIKQQQQGDNSLDDLINVS